MKHAKFTMVGLLAAFTWMGCSNSATDKSDELSIDEPSSLPGGGASPTPSSGEPQTVFFAEAADGTCAINGAEATCAGEAFESESIPLDIYVMFDRSGSMCNCVDPIMDGQTACPAPGCRKTRMEAIREAVNAFVNDEGSRGIGIGVGYFGQQSIGSADCRPETYSEPSVSIDVLPSNIEPIMASLNGADPIGETPTGGAIRGACSYAKAWKTAHTDHQTVILFVTDGEPKAPVTCANGVGACCPMLDDAVVAATECLDGNPGIKTYVLGVGPFLSNLSQIAVAGGTKQAYLVEEGDVTAQVLSSLNAIRGDAGLPCEFGIPQSQNGQTLDPGKIGIAYANGNCVGEAFYRVASASACGTEDGWYFDDPVAPTQVRLCTSSCSQVSANGGSLFYSVGCGWETPPPQ